MVRQFRHRIERNRGWILQNHLPHINYFTDSSEKNWLLIGAAPSLDQSFSAIQQYRDNGWKIAACDMALFPLLHRDILPDILFTCESRPYPFFLFQKCNLPDLRHTTLIAPAMVHPAQLPLLQSLGIRKFIFFHWMEDPLKIEGLSILPSGGNVLNAMLVFLGGLRGAHLKILAGDYSFTNAGFYPRGTANSLLGFILQNRFSNPETMLQNTISASIKLSPNTYTTRAFEAYKKWQKKYLSLLNESGHVTVDIITLEDYS